MREKSRDYIHPSGGLLSIQFIQKLKQENTKEKYVESQTFSMPGEEPLPPGELDKKMTHAWKSLLEKWFSISPFIRKYDISEARKKWIIPLLEALDFNPQYLKKDTLISEEKMTKIPLSHRGGDWPYAPIIHTVAPSQDLDEKITKGRGEKSPHDALQIYLNESREDQWGIVTNGIVLRILRDYYHTYTKGYVEFDLESIFEVNSFSDYRALYRLVHPSRFIPDEEGISPLEHFYKISLAAGEKIGNELRVNVLNAIEALGNGFLTKELRDILIEDPEECKAYYQEILHVIYRIIFLLFAEQRGMLPTRDSLYAEAYSLTRLGEKVEKTKRRDMHYDLWRGLLVTFDIVRRGVDDPDSKLTAFGYNGSLFDESKIKRLINLKCENTGILSAIRNLTYFESEHTLQRISYVDLGVEEIGSIYESLLDYTPRITNEDILFDGKTYTEGTFYLDSRGTARKSTGSYYTHPGLINELIQSALKPVLEDRLTGKESAEEKERALLSIKVCDPACGSGAFLIAATNFLGKELAKIRTDTDYPPDKEERKARRDVLQHCIYGVDLNPMAVELAKVSLWINACVEDMPLNFLDHHIKCGDSLIGATPHQLKEGIPSEAFEPERKDIKSLAAKMRKKNEREKNQMFLDEFEERKEKKWAEKYRQLAELEELKPSDIERKKTEYAEILNSPQWLHEKLIADVWCAAFFWPLKSNELSPPTESIFRLLQKRIGGKSNDAILFKANNLAEEHRFFHWYLEFPDVFDIEEKGFDCILGNPQFLGGLKISSTYGDNYRHLLSMLYAPFGGTADLCTSFYRQAFSLLKLNGILGMVATNTIGQGDTRESGLAVIIQNDGSITSAHRFVKWPGDASVEVTLLAIRKGKWEGGRFLDTKQVSYISSRLDDFLEVEPESLSQNEGKAFQGDIVRGKGFVLDLQEAEEIIAKDANNKSCLFPYLNGKDLNTHPGQESSRFVICFKDSSLEKAKEFPDLIHILENRVRPIREKVRDKHEREKWWLFARYRKELRQAIADLQKVLVRSRISELHMLSFVPNGLCYSDETIVFAFEDEYHFALLQSSIHETWVRLNASTLRTDIRYTPEDCFDTFPFPQEVESKKKEIASQIGKEYHQHRFSIMQNQGIGLTKIYNLFHDQECKDADIHHLRELHIQMDKSILACYGWEDIDPQHGFYEDERGQLHFMIHPQAKLHVLSRLLKLNLQVSAMERDETDIEEKLREIEIWIQREAKR